mgnify:CR=1 FL=1
MLIVGGDVGAGDFDSDDDCDVDDDAACVDYDAGDGEYGLMMVVMALMVSMAVVLKLWSVMSGGDGDHVRVDVDADGDDGGVGDDDGACDAKHVGSEGDGDDAMLIMVAATMMSRWPCRPWRWHGVLGRCRDGVVLKIMRRMTLILAMMMVV